MRQFSDDAKQLGIPLARLARLLGVRAGSLHRWSKATKVTNGYKLTLDKLDLLYSISEGSQKFRLQTDEKIIERMINRLAKELGVDDPEEKERKIIQVREGRKLIAERTKELRSIISNRRDLVRQAKEYLAGPVDDRPKYERKLAEFSTELAAAETELATILTTGQLPELAPPPPPPTPETLPSFLRRPRLVPTPATLTFPIHSPEYSIDVEPDCPLPTADCPYTHDQLDWLNRRHNPYIDYNDEQYYRDDHRQGGFYSQDGQPLPPDFWEMLGPEALTD